MKHIKIIKFKRFVALLFALLFSTNLAFAEVSGGFIGFGVGMGTNYAKIINNWNMYSLNHTFGGMKGSYGFVLGYKQFFTRYVGLRYYASVDTTYGSTDTFGGSGKFKIHAIAYAANIDFIGNFVSTKSVDFGAFVGFGFGAMSWRSKMLQSEYATTIGKSPNSTGFDIPINAGLRVNFAHYHGIELALRWHFLTTRFIDYYESETMRWRFDLGQTYNALLRYTASF